MAEFETLVWYGEDLERQVRHEANFRVMVVDSLLAVNRHLTWERDMAKKERAGFFSNPALNLTVGILIGTLVTGWAIHVP